MANTQKIAIIWTYQKTNFRCKLATSRPPVTLRDCKPGAWVLYQQVIDQSKADIFIKPGIIQRRMFFRPEPILHTSSEKVKRNCHKGSWRCYACQKHDIKALCIPHGEGRKEFCRTKYGKRDNMKQPAAYTGITSIVIFTIVVLPVL
jgi:hypothetical protein